MIALPMAYENTVAMTPTTRPVATTTRALADHHPCSPRLRGERHADGRVAELLADDQDAEHGDQEVADRGAGEHQAEAVLHLDVAAPHGGRDEDGERDGDDGRQEQQHEVRASGAELDPLGADGVPHAGDPGVPGAGRSRAPAAAGDPARNCWAALVPSRNASSSDDDCGASSCSGMPRRAGQVADGRGGGAEDLGGVRPVVGDGRALALQRRAERGHAGAADPDPRAGVAGHEVGHRGVGDQPALSDDDQVVGHQRHLGQQVAGDEHAPPLPGQVGQELADPLDALGVEAVGRLVEDQGVGVAEEGGGEAQPLPHAQREPGHRPSGHLGQPDHGQHLLDPAPAQSARRGDGPEVVAGGARRVGVGGVEQGPDLRGRMGDAAVRLPAEAWPCRRSAGRAAGAAASSCSCPSRWGRGSP